MARLQQTIVSGTVLGTTIKYRTNRQILWLNGTDMLCRGHRQI